ncbi:MAG TPA: hypothetical protein VFW46_22735, partial [Stellaceae bacterium]|nr:hypothetical protein [Stellaceae bacterium]
VKRHLVHFDQTLTNASPQVSIGHAERDPELAGNSTLRNAAVALDQSEKAPHNFRVVFAPRLAHVLELPIHA